jgi:hypothetical protein
VNKNRKEIIKESSKRNRTDFKMAVHYNDNGKLFCAARGTSPAHTTDKAEVTCSHCLRKFTANWKWRKPQ